MQKIYNLIVFLWATVFTTVAFCIDMPRLTGRVVDEVGILTLGQKESIEAVLSRDTNNQVVLVTLKSLRGMEIEEYANRLFNHWKLGDKEKNNGVLIVIAPNEKQARIEVGYGLEHILTDAIASHIMRQDIIPFAKKGDYGVAAFNASQRVIEVLAQDTNVVKDASFDTLKKRILSFLFSGDGFIFLILGFVLLWNLFVWLLKLLGITSLFGYRLGYITFGHSGGFSSRGRSRSFGGRSRSFGGWFRGGGGRSGGGGASGRW